MNYKFYEDENGISEFPLAMQQKFIILQEEKSLNTYGKRDGNMNSGEAIKLEIPVDAKRLEKSIQRVIDENDALRLIFLKKGNEYLQKVITDYQFTLDVYDMEENGIERDYDDAISHIIDFFNQEIDYFNELSIKFQLIKLGKKKNIFIMVAHHWIGDGSTAMLVIEQIMKYYMNPKAEKDEKGQFIDFVKEEYAFVASEKGQKQLEYWKKELEGYQNIDISKAAEGNPSEASDQFVRIQKASVEKAAQRNNTSNFNIMLLSYHIAISEILGQNDTVIGFACANRLKKKYYKTIGYLSRAVQHRMKISENDRLSDLLQISVKKFSENTANQQTSHYNDNSQFYISHATFQKKDSPVTTMRIPIKRVLTFMLMAVSEEESEIVILFAGDNTMFAKKFLSEFVKYIECTVELLADSSDVAVSEIKKFYEEKYYK